MHLLRGWAMASVVSLSDCVFVSSIACTFYRSLLAVWPGCEVCNATHARYVIDNVVTRATRTAGPDTEYITQWCKVNKNMGSVRRGPWWSLSKWSVNQPRARCPSGQWHCPQGDRTGHRTQVSPQQAGPEVKKTSTALWHMQWFAGVDLGGPGIDPEPEMEPVFL